MCGICNVVNCIRRNICGGCGTRRYTDSCGCRANRNVDDCGCNSRYAEPRTNVVCANQQNDCYKPCCGNDDCNCRRNNHHHDNCCE